VTVMADRNLRKLSVAELDAAIAGTEEQLRSARHSGSAIRDIAALEAIRCRVLNEFRRRGL
jgi:hypothetical protein